MYLNEISQTPTAMLMQQRDNLRDSIEALERDPKLRANPTTYNRLAAQLREIEDELRRRKSL